MVFALVAIPALIAAVTLLGRAMGSIALTATFLPDGTMDGATAIGIILMTAAIGVYLPGAQKRPWRKFGFAIAALIGTGSLLKLIDMLAGSGLSVDSWLFSTIYGVDGTRSSSTSPGVPLNFILLSLAMILARLPLRHRSERTAHHWAFASQVFALATSLASLLALIDYIYESNSFIGLLPFTPMAANTALCFIMLSIAVSQISPSYGFMRYVANNGSAGRMAKVLLPVSICVPVGLGWLRSLGMQAGIWDAEFGVSLSVVMNVVILFSFTFIAARKLYQADLKAKQVEDELIYRATHDSLTGLVTRPVFREQLQRRLKLATRHQDQPFAVLYLDLDGFKQVNDMLGHDAGDHLLMEVADTLRVCTRASDTVARLGGDEFVILLEEIASREDAALLAGRILAAMPRSFPYGDRQVPVGISIGVAVNTRQNATPDDMLRDADLALYKAKTKGKGRYEMAA